MHSSLLKGATGVVAILAMICPPAAAAPSRDHLDSGIDSYFKFIHQVSIAQARGAVAQFTEDAVVIAGPFCTREAPCTGRGAIQSRYVAPLISGRTALPLAEQRFEADELSVFGTFRGAGAASTTAQRGRFIFTFRDGRIARLVFEPDMHDPAKASAIAKRPGRVHPPYI